MHKTCKNCGAHNSEHASFCSKCGASLHAHAHEQTPADQAAEMSAKARRLWLGLSLNEKIMGIGALVSLVAFILPWASVGPESVNGFSASANNASYLYLLPLLMVASLVILYFTRGASETREVLMAKWQIIIGSVAATTGLLVIVFFNIIGGLLSAMGGLSSILGGSISSISAGIGVYIYAAGAIAVAVGAFRRQGEVLQRTSSRRHD